jgi:hypothetical protein
MKNIPPTKKEKIILRALVKLGSKEELFQELINSLQSYGRSNLVGRSAKLVGVNLSDSSISPQYLNYAVNNYEKIKEQEFPDEFERTQTLKVESKSQVTRLIVEKRKMIVPYLPSMSKVVKDDVEENFWDYDPELYDEDYIDSENDWTEHFYEDKSMPWIDNVIE